MSGPPDPHDISPGFAGHVAERAYAGEGDYARIRRLLVETFALAGPAVYATVGDLDWWRFTDDDPAAIGAARLWIDAAGAAVGVAWPKGDEVDLLVHPRHRAIAGAMLAWAEGRRRAAVAGEAVPPILTARAYDGDRARIATLTARGYARTARCYRLHGQALDAPPPPAPLPPGYAIRQIAGEGDLERRVAVHRDAFAPSRMTVAKHRAVMAAPTYRADLDLVVVAPDGAFAAYCLVWFDASNRIGLFEPVGCHSAHRRRGLTTAVLAAGLRRLRALGARAAYVNSAGDAIPANRLYAAAGFRPLDEDHAWTKAL